MKKLLMLFTLFILTAGAFAYDIKDVSKKVESFNKSGTYIKTIDVEYGDVIYYYKQHIVTISISAKTIKISFDGGSSVTYENNDYETIHKIYLEDNNLVIEWE